MLSVLIFGGEFTETKENQFIDLSTLEKKPIVLALDTKKDKCTILLGLLHKFKSLFCKFKVGL